MIRIRISIWGTATLSEHSEAYTFTFQLLLHSRQPLCSSLCPLCMVKAILTVWDKHRPNTSKARGESKSKRRTEFFAEHTHFPCSHVLFAHSGGGRISCFTGSCRCYTVCCCHPCMPSCKEQRAMCGRTALHLFWWKVCAAINKKKKGINQTGRARRGICFSLVISCPILCLRNLLLSLSASQLM